jgi:hypothetical protein
MKAQGKFYATSCDDKGELPVVGLQRGRAERLPVSSKFLQITDIHLTNEGFAYRRMKVEIIDGFGDLIFEPSAIA